MAKVDRIMMLCARCRGTGMQKDPLDDVEDEDFEKVVCSDCDGTGAIHWGWVVKARLPDGEEEPPISEEPEEEPEE